MKRSIRATVVALTAAGFVALGATGASAHVTVSADTTEAGSYAILTFSVPHGCGTSPTHTVSIQIPEEIPAVTPTVNSGWELEKVVEPLDPPLDDGHGGQLTERVSEIVYTTDNALPADQRDAFELSVRLPDSPGEELAFPTVQTCDEGDAAWIQLAAEGEDPDELEMPSPTITLTAGGETDGTVEPAADEPATEETVDAPAEQNTAPSDSGGSDGATTSADGGSGVPAAVPWTALVLGAGGLALGGLAFVRSRSAS